MFRGLRESVLLLSRLRKDWASNGPTWLPLVLVLAAIAGVAYALSVVGRRRAASDQAIAAYDQAVANYRETVLTGFQ